MSPFGFDDEQLAQLMTAAAPLPPECRAEFMQAVINALAGAELGPGTAYRKIAELQRSYLSGDGQRWGRGAEGTEAEPA